MYDVNARWWRWQCAFAGRRSSGPPSQGFSVRVTRAWHFSAPGFSACDLPSVPITDARRPMTVLGACAPMCPPHSKPKSLRATHHCSLPPPHSRHRCPPPNPIHQLNPERWLSVLSDSLVKGGVLPRSRGRSHEERHLDTLLALVKDLRQKGATVHVEYCNMVSQRAGASGWLA
jgi:hypothetical protein